MKFTLQGNSGTIYTGHPVMVAGIRCVYGTAMVRRRNRKGTGFRTVEMETTARVEDVDFVADVETVEVVETV